METKQKFKKLAVNYRNPGINPVLYLIALSGLLTTISLTACSSDDPGNDPQTNNLAEGGTVTGSVKDQASRPYPGTTVVISKGSETLSKTTDSQGTFTAKTKGEGTYDVKVTPPLSTELSGNSALKVDVSIGQSAKIDISIQTNPIRANLIIGSADILGELKNSNGNTPTGSELLYAANVFDPPFGQLTAVKAPDKHHISLTEWKEANGEATVNCNGNKAMVNVDLEGMIPGGTYTMWLNFLNKKKEVGEPIDFANDLVQILPLGAGSGTENIVIAQNNGTLIASIEHDSCILTKAAGLVLVVIYHINGNTYGSAHIPDKEEISQLLFYFQ